MSVTMERLLAIYGAVNEHGRRAERRYKHSDGLWEIVDPTTEKWDISTYEYRLCPVIKPKAIDQKEFWIAVRESGGVRNLSVWLSREEAERNNPNFDIIHVGVLDITTTKQEQNDDGSRNT